MRQIVIFLVFVPLSLLEGSPELLSAPPATTPFPSEAQLDNAAASLAARTLLANDPLLAPLNLGVRVRGPNACLWGAVSSEAHSLRADALVRHVPGISS